MKINKTGEFSTSGLNMNEIPKTVISDKTITKEISTEIPTMGISYTDKRGTELIV